MAVKVENQRGASLEEKRGVRQDVSFHQISLTGTVKRELEDIPSLKICGKTITHLILRYADDTVLIAEI